MIRFRRFLVLAALVVAAGTIATPLHAQRATHTKARARAKAEPSFDGRTLTQWVADLDGLAPVTRSAAAYALAAMGPDGVKGVPALVKTLADEVPAVRFPAAYALGEIGPGAIEAVPALEKLLDDRSDDVAHIARKSLKRITGKEYNPED
jgi:hypothetical protein